MVKKNALKNFGPMPDIYTYSESRILNGNIKVIRWYKNGILTDVFGNPIKQSSLPKYGIKNNNSMIPYKSGISKQTKEKLRRKLSSKYSSGMSSSQLLSYNQRIYEQQTQQLKKNK